MTDSFSTRLTAILFIASAMLLPMILLTESIFSSGFYMVLFIIAQLALISFFNREEYGFHAWYAFIAAITGLCFMLAIVLIGRSLRMEYLGFVIFIAYFIGGIILLMQKVVPGPKRDNYKEAKPKAYQDFYELEDESISDFRAKDELEKLAHDFSIQAPPKSSEVVSGKIYDFEEIFENKRPSAYTGDLSDSSEEESWSGTAEGAEELEEQRKDYSSGSWIGAKDEDGESEDYKVQLLKQRIEEERKADDYPVYQKEEPKSEPKQDYPRFSDYFKTHHSYIEGEEEKFIVKQKAAEENAPSVNFDEVKTHLQTIDDGVKKISDKIKEIGEKAIKEGEEKKKKLSAPVLEKKANPEPKQLSVYASKNGTKYHHDRSCPSLKRVSKKNIIIFKDHKEARKRGLKACGLCRK